ncbi:MAG: M14 family zinc carboxypeptidase [Armatimonadota bacterium]
MPYKKSEAIDAVVQYLASTFPAVASTGTLPNASWHGRTPAFLQITKGSGDGAKPGVLIVAGVHAREWAPPDAVTAFCWELLVAYQGKLPLTIGAFVLPAPNVQAIVDNLNIYVAPVINPDGRNHSLRRSASRSGRLWRKNRNRLPDGEIGVDIARNHDILWDFPRLYSPDAAQASESTGATSTTSSKETYYGPAVESESETKNIKWLLTDRDIRLFIDVHSYGSLILYPWAIEQNQLLTSDMRFSNPNWDLLRDGTLDTTGYREFIPSVQWSEHARLGLVIGQAIAAATSSGYRIQPASRLYYVSGTPLDYAFSLNLEIMRAFTIECGAGRLGGFHPDFNTQFPTVKLEVEAALAGALDDVVRGLLAGTPFGRTPPPLAMGTSPSGPGVPPPGMPPGGGAGPPGPGGGGGFFAAVPTTPVIPSGLLAGGPTITSVLGGLVGGVGPFPTVSLNPSALGPAVLPGPISPGLLAAPAPIAGPPVHLMRLSPIRAGEGDTIRGTLLDQSLDFTQVDPARFRILMTLVWSSGFVAGAITAIIQQFRFLGPQDLEFVIPPVQPSLGGIPPGRYSAYFEYAPARWSVDGERQLEIA